MWGAAVDIALAAVDVSVALAAVDVAVAAVDVAVAAVDVSVAIAAADVAVDVSVVTAVESRGVAVNVVGSGGVAFATADGCDGVVVVDGCVAGEFGGGNRKVNYGNWVAMVVKKDVIIFKYILRILWTQCIQRLVIILKDNEFNRDIQKLHVEMLNKPCL